MKVFAKIIIAVGAIALTAAAYFGATAYYDRKCSNFSEDIDFYIYPDADKGAVLDSIVSSGKVLKPKSLKRVFSDTLTLRPGHYVIEAGKPSIYVPRMISKGWQTPVTLALSGSIRSRSALVRKISSQMLIDSASVAEALYSPEFLAAHGTDSVRLFSIIIPDNYEVYWTDDMDRIFDMFSKEYDAFWTAERTEKAKGLGLDRYQVSILASIVNGETRYVPEMPRVAGVYLTRLERGMKLQADPTVAYCFGYTLNRILKVHLQVDSPYNTYKYAGLPPGPISCPPKECIEAVLNPICDGSIFFCAKETFDGTHNFAKTYSEHLSNARAFQRALNNRKK